MEKDTLKKIKSFADSDINSVTEHEFTTKELKAFFDKKLRYKYAKRLDQEFAIRKQNTKDEIPKKGAHSIMNYWFLILMLIGAILCFALYYTFNKHSKEKSSILVAYKSELYTPVDFNVRGNISEYQQLVSKLNEAYVKKDFATVIAEYQKLKSDGGLYELNVEQMAGIAFASLENYVEAINIFKGILNTKESKYSNHTTVRYLLGLVYLLNADKPSAIEILQQIKKGDYKYDKTQSILEQL